MAAKKQTSMNKEVEERGFAVKRPGFPVDDTTVIHNLRLHKIRKEALQYHFKGQGLTLSSGIRQVLYDWMDKQKITPLPKREGT